MKEYQIWIMGALLAVIGYRQECILDKLKELNKAREK